jgi:type II secretory ATPase GspE/PulE/Tfp pilus assembly ATPase PilB-like protein
VSIEDPIEVPYLNFNQIELNAELGFGIETCIRTVLRQDPDLIMIGEIRDAKTARLALEAVLTGHLVLTSLHAPSNLGVIDRLKQLGINPEEIIPYLHLLVSQRYHEEKKQVQFELLELTPEIKQNILNHPGHHAICQSIIC